MRNDESKNGINGQWMPDKHDRSSASILCCGTENHSNTRSDDVAIGAAVQIRPNVVRRPKDSEHPQEEIKQEINAIQPIQIKQMQVKP